MHHFTPLQSSAATLTRTEILVALAVLLTSLLVTFHRASVGALPTPVSRDAPAHVFSEQRARDYLDAIMSFGSQRTVGSEANEVRTPEYIIQEVKAIQKATGAKIEVERQYGSGSFSLDFLGKFTSVYANVQNVIVLLHGAKDDISTGALMLSAHYDSPVGTRGASDNAANVANLLEILKILAHERENVPRAVLFMFTGAEETILQGSHMFARSNHRWVKNVRAFINLEAAGSGGRELMFQATNNRMTQAWARGSPYPHGSIIGQEVFQSGIIPSDTDFRMYVAELNIPGMDWANVENGQNYHTLLDTPENIHAGSMQRYGANILETTRELLKDDDFWADVAAPDAGQKKQGAIIFFDVLGLFVIIVPPFVALLLGLVGFAILILFLSSALGSFSSPDYVEYSMRWLAMKKILQAFARCLTYPLLIGVLIHFLFPMFHYSHQEAVLLLYFFPALYGLVSSMSPPTSGMLSTDIKSMFRAGSDGDSAPDPVVNKDDEAKRARSRLELLTFSSAVGLWAMLLVVLVLKGKGSSYLSWCWVVFPSTARMVHAWFASGRVHRFEELKERRTRQQLLEYKRSAWVGTVFGSIVPFVLMFPLLLVVLRFFIPITGRSGHRVPGDVIVAVVCGICTFFLTILPGTLLMLLPAPTMALLRKFLLWCSFLALWIPVLLPDHSERSVGFTPTYPKRVYAIHVDSFPHNSDSSSFIWIIDADSSMSHRLIDAIHAKDSSLFSSKDIQTANCDTERAVYCGLPWYLPMMTEIPTSVKIPVREQALPNRKCMLTKLREEVSPIDGGNRRLHFCLDAPERGNLFFRDTVHGGPVAWSFSAPLAPTAGHLYVLIANGKAPDNGNCFWVDIPKKQKLEVAWACHYLEESVRPPHLRKFLAALPNWATPVSFTAKWRDAIF